MGGQTTVGNLAVDMTLNSAAFQADFSRLTKSMEVGSKAVSNSLGFIATGLGALAGGLASVSFVQLIQGSLKATEQLKVQADQLGASTTELQEFRYAGSAVGVAAGDMDKALQKLNVQIGLAAAGSAKQKGLFDALGISVKNADGSARGAYDVFAELAGSIGLIENPATRAATLSALLGEEVGVKMVPLLAKGSEGLRSLRDDAHKLGIVLSEDAIAKSGEAASQIDTLKKVLEVNISTAVAENAGAIATLAQSITELAVAAVKFAATDIERVKELTGVLGGAHVGARAGPLGAIAGGAAGGFLAAGGQRSGSAEIYNRAGGGIRGAWEVLTSSRDDLLNAAKTAEARAKGGNPPFNYDITRGTGIRPGSSGAGASPNMDALAKMLAGGGKGGGGSRSPREKAAASLDFPTPEELDRAIADMQRQAEAGVRRATELIATAVKAEGGDIGEAIIGADGLMSDARWAKLTEQAERYVEMTDRAERFATQFAASLDSAFEDAILSGGGLGNALKGLGEDLLRLVFRIMVIEPLARKLSNTLSGLLSGGGGGGGGLGSLISAIGASFGGAKASGGPVSPGSWYLTGEEGPELFAPKTPGMILPAEVTRGLMGSGGSTVVNVDARGAQDPAAVERAALTAFVAARQYTDASFESRSRVRLARGAGAF